MIRLDKYVSGLWLFSRSEVAQWCKAWCILVDGQIIKKSDTKIPRWAKMDIMLGGEDQEDNLSIEVREKVTILLYKPKGFVCSDVVDGWHPSYKELIEACPYREMLHVAGRLDQDTTGLVVVTSDGELNHRIISPKHKLVKTYIVSCRLPVSDMMRQQLENGVVLDDGYKTLPAVVKQDATLATRITLQITEGKYHQVKRMLEAIGNEVIELHRESIGPWSLDGLKEWERRYLEQ